MKFTIKRISVLLVALLLSVLLIGLNVSYVITTNNVTSASSISVNDASINSLSSDELELYILPINTELDRNICNQVTGTLSSAEINTLPIYSIIVNSMMGIIVNDNIGAEGIIANDYDITYNYINGTSDELGEYISYMPNRVDLVGVDYFYYNMIEDDPSTLNYIMTLVFKLSFDNNPNVIMSLFVNPSTIYAIELFSYDNSGSASTYLYYNYNRSESIYFSNSSDLFKYNTDDILILDSNSKSLVSTRVANAGSNMITRVDQLYSDLESMFGPKNETRISYTLDFDVSTWNIVPDPNIYM